MLHVKKYLSEKRGYKFLRQDGEVTVMIEPGKAFFKMFLFPTGEVRKGNSFINAVDVTFPVNREAEFFEWQERLKNNA